MRRLAWCGFGNGSIKRKKLWPEFLSLIVPLFVSAFDRADQLANAMEARGYDPSRKRTRYKVLKMQTIDYASMILSVVVLCACIGIWVL